MNKGAYTLHQLLLKKKFTVLFNVIICDCHEILTVALLKKLTRFRLFIQKGDLKKHSVLIVKNNASCWGHVFRSQY
jgi:hypothetical protein